MHIVTRLVKFVLLGCVALILISCPEMWGSMDNPADEQSDSYQGFMTVNDPSAVTPVQPVSASSVFAPILVANQLIGAESYQFQIAASSDFASPVYDAVSVGNSLAPADWMTATTSVTYFWRVRAKVNGTWSDWPASNATFSLVSPDFGEVSPLEDSITGDKTPLIEWHDLTGATGYEIQIASAMSEVGNATVESAPGSEYQLPVTLTTGDIRYWRIRARNAEGTKTVWSNAVSFTVGDPVIFTSVMQTGGMSTNITTTGLILNFSADPTTLTTGNISIIGAAKGTLSGTGTTRSISIANITVVNGETISVAVSSPPGYALSGSPKIAVVYKATIGQIEAGDYHTIILNTNGSVLATGDNADGQLGDGTTTSRFTPVEVGTGIKTIETGDYFTMFLKTDGSVWATGENGSGQLGDGTTADRSNPVEVMTGIQSVSAGERHTLFLKTDGTSWATGNNTYGQLGDGTWSNSTSPVQVMPGVEAVAAGGFHTLFLKTDGTVWASGDNSYGQLGDGTTTERRIPVQVMTGVKSVAAGYSHSLFLKTDGSVWASGLNSSGQLGDGTTTNRATPVQVIIGIQTVETGSLHTMFLKNDGTVWACGENSYKQLGDGTTIDRLLPVQVMTGVKAVAVGYRHTLFLKTDGLLWAVGDNYSGQLGDGTTTNRSIPIIVM